MCHAQSGRPVSSNGAEYWVPASGFLDISSILLKSMGMWTRETWLSRELHGSCEAEPTLKAPSMGQKQQRAIFIQVIMFISLVTDGVWSHRELSTKLDSLALLSAPLLLGPQLRSV